MMLKNSMKKRQFCVAFCDKSVYLCSNLPRCYAISFGLYVFVWCMVLWSVWVCVLWLFLHFVHVSYQLPQQENSFDCGLFLLHYLELFLVEAPVNFSPFRINEFNKFVSSPHQMFLWKILHFYFSKAKSLNMVESCILNSAR